MKQYGLTEQEIMKRSEQLYGSAEAQNKAAIERSFPQGYQHAEIQVGVSDMAF